MNNNLDNVSSGDVVKFITKVNKSGHDENTQEVILKVTEVDHDKDLVKGINAMRALDLNEDRKPFRSYKISNIVKHSIWKLIG